MKVGIISFFNNGNFGSSLQAYALHEKLKELGYDPCYITVKERKLIRPFYILCLGIDYVIRSLIQPRLIKNYFMMKQLSKKNPILNSDTRDKVNNFVIKNINNMTIGRYDLQKEARSNDFIAFICGSDQIWSPLPINLRLIAFYHLLLEIKELHMLQALE